MSQIKTMPVPALTAQRMVSDGGGNWRVATVVIEGRKRGLRGEGNIFGSWRNFKKTPVAVDREWGGIPFGEACHPELRQTVEAHFARRKRTLFEAGELEGGVRMA